jgi:hypothetical protein
MHTHHQKICRFIPGKDAPGSITSMGSWCQTNDYYCRLGITIPRHWFAPIIPSHELFAFFCRNSSSEFHQPGAGRAMNQIMIKLLQVRFYTLTHNHKFTFLVSAEPPLMFIASAGKVV